MDLIPSLTSETATAAHQATPGPATCFRPPILAGSIRITAVTCPMPTVDRHFSSRRLLLQEPYLIASFRIRQPPNVLQVRSVLGLFRLLRELPAIRSPVPATSAWTQRSARRLVCPA